MKQPPKSLADITLSQWVEFQNKYGKDLDKRLREARNMSESDKKREELQQIECDILVKNYCHYTNSPLNIVDTLGLYEVIKVQGIASKAWKHEEIQLDYRNIFSWRDEMWDISPVYPATDKLTKEHYDIVTEIALIFSDLQDGKHEALYDLCAAYLRKIGEPFTIALIEQRRADMMQLPLSISLCVKKYIEDSIKQLINI